jgi:hypothetical protein
MTRESLRAGTVTTTTISEALLSSRGDLFVAASILGVTGRELDSYIRASDELQNFAAAIGSVKASGDYKRFSDEQFADELERLTKGYRLEALDVIHELATMTYDSAAMAEVKLKAAVALRGAPEAKVGTQDNGAVLAELNAIYQESAPRIRTVRAIQIEYQS